MWKTHSHHVRVPVEFLRLVRSSNDIHLYIYTRYTGDVTRGKHLFGTPAFLNTFFLPLPIINRSVIYCLPRRRTSIPYFFPLLFLLFFAARTELFRFLLLPFRGVRRILININWNCKQTAVGMNTTIRINASSTRLMTVLRHRGRGGVPSNAHVTFLRQLAKRFPLFPCPLICRGGNENDGIPSADCNLALHNSLETD